MPETQPVHLGKYEILAEIGKGGFATVYRARDPDLGRDIALKVLDPLLMRDPAWVARFRQEARVIAGLDHPRIVPIYEIGQAEGILFIAMKLLEGGSLADRIAHGPLSWSEVVRLTSEIAEGLAFAHGRGVLHRDLKPANVLLDASGHAVLTDFGFARMVADHSLSVSVSGGVVGTPAYIAPEVWEGQPPTAQTDLYALRCIVYEMAAGKRLFAGGTTPAVMRAHFQPLPLPDRWPEAVPPGLGNVLGTALAQAPADRYVHAGELAEAVASLGDDTLAEPYAALQAALPAGDWLRALALVGQIRTQKPDYRDIAALEAQALGGQERVARAEQAATWRAEAEAALARGDRGGAVSATKQWAALTPDDPMLAQFRSRMQEGEQPAVALPGRPPKPARRFPLWVAAGTTALVLLVAVVSLAQRSRRVWDGSLMLAAPATATIAFIAVAPAATVSLTSPPSSPALSRTPQPSITLTLAETPLASASHKPSVTPTGTPEPPTSTLIPLTDTPEPPTRTLTPRAAHTPTPRLSSPLPATRSNPAPTPSPLSGGQWYWRGHGPFRPGFGAMAFVNYTDRPLRIRIEMVGEYELSAQKGSTFAKDLPEAYDKWRRTYVEVDGYPVTNVTPCDLNFIRANQAAVYSVEIGPGDSLDVGCPWFEGPDTR